MNSKKFFDWCRTAVSSIKHWPQRDGIHKDLYDHLEDSYTAFREQGDTHEKAEDKALATMGDPKEVAAQLAKTYKPFWPKLLVATRCGIAASVVFAIAVVLLFVPVDDIMPMTHIDLIHKGIATYKQRTEVTQETNGYTMTVTRIAYEPYMKDLGGEKTIEIQKNLLLLDMDATHPQIWMYPPDVLQFWAKDSAGNMYRVGAEYREVFRNGDRIYYVPHTGLFQYTYQLRIQGIEIEGLDWVELRAYYNGESLAWRIDLPGGGSE